MTEFEFKEKNPQCKNYKLLIKVHNHEIEYHLRFSWPQVVVVLGKTKKDDAAQEVDDEDDEREDPDEEAHFIVDDTTHEALKDLRTRQKQEAFFVKLNDLRKEKGSTVEYSEHKVHRNQLKSTVGGDIELKP